MSSIKASYFKMVKFKLRWMLVAFALLIASLFSRSAMADKAMPSSNAYDYYARAAVVLPKDVPKSTFPDVDGGSPDEIAPYHSAQERNEAVLKSYAPALKLLRDGFAFKYERSSDIDNPNFPFNPKMRQIARVLMLESKIKVEKGDWTGATYSAVDGIRLGQDISHGTIIDLLVGVAVQAIDRKPLRATLTHTNASAARAAAKRLEGILFPKLLYADVLKTEKANEIRFFATVEAEPNWRKQYPTSKSIEELTTSYIKIMDGLIANAQLPYPERKTSIKKPDDLLNQDMTGLYWDPKKIKYGTAQGLLHATQRTQNLFVMVEFALRAYFLEHGRYPETLKALSPDYLQNAPDDPFAANQSLRYVTDEKTYTLFSIGPDGKDDDGKPIKEGNVSPDSKGDMVAGVKNW